MDPAGLKADEAVHKRGIKYTDPMRASTMKRTAVFHTLFFRITTPQYSKLARVSFSSTAENSRMINRSTEEIAVARPRSRLTNALL